MIHKIVTTQIDERKKNIYIYTYKKNINDV